MQKSPKELDLQKKLTELQSVVERFDLIARATNDILWDWNIETDMVWRGEGARQRFGYSQDELVGSYELWVKRIHPKDQKRVEDSLSATIQKGEKYWEGQYRFQCKDGSYATVLDRGFFVYNAEGKAVRAAGAMVDITRQIETETKLKAERNLLRTLIDNLPDAIFVKDFRARKTLANPADVKHLGCKTEAEVLTKTDFDFFPRAVAGKLFEDDKAVLNGQPLINREEKVSTPSGETFWLLTTKIPWRDAYDNIIGLIGIARDITKQKETETKLKAERNLLRTVIDNLPDAIYVKDDFARKTLANPADLRNMGCKTEAEILGRTDYDFFPKEAAEHFFEDDQLVLKKGQPVINREEKVVTPAGETFWLLTTKVPWRDAHGNIIGLVGIGRDITDKKSLEMQLLRAQRMESIGRLATGIAHDLNNILAPILICSTLLREKIQDKEGLDMLTTVEASAKRGAAVVKQVLLFGRGVEGQRIPISLKHFLKDIAHIATDTFNHSIQVKTEIAADLWPVASDPAQLHQMLLNLCFNARDAMKTGGKLTIAARNFNAESDFVAANVEARAGRYVLLEITDTGCGIPHESQEKIFEPFFTTKELGKGAGLGLSTVLSIVKSHDGFILVESEVGKGSRFRIYLPAQ